MEADCRQFRSQREEMGRGNQKENRGENNLIYARNSAPVSQETKGKSKSQLNKKEIGSKGTVYHTKVIERPFTPAPVPPVQPIYILNTADSYQLLNSLGVNPAYLKIPRNPNNHIRDLSAESRSKAAWNDPLGPKQQESIGNFMEKNGNGVQPGNEKDSKLIDALIEELMIIKANGGSLLQGAFGQRGFPDQKLVGAESNRTRRETSLAQAAFVSKENQHKAPSDDIDSSYPMEFDSLTLSKSLMNGSPSPPPKILQGPLKGVQNGSERHIDQKYSKKKEIEEEKEYEENETPPESEYPEDFESLAPSKVPTELTGSNAGASQSFGSQSQYIMCNRCKQRFHKTKGSEHIRECLSSPNVASLIQQYRNMEVSGSIPEEVSGNYGSSSYASGGAPEESSATNSRLPSSSSRLSDWFWLFGESRVQRGSAGRHRRRYFERKLNKRGSFSITLNCIEDQRASLNDQFALWNGSV